MAEEKQQYRADNYHESFDPSKLKNADLNISQYWDDSSMKNYSDPNRWWGENVKYEWEGTKNSQVAYNPNATIEWLDPNYKYGHEAQMANSEEANYIARRNDEIASALYNAWKTSQLDVADFLNSQQWFYNSNTAERHNTVQSIWKRLGQMVEQNNQSDTKSVEPTNTPQDTNNEALSNMESELNQSTAGELYGKVTADQSTAIQTLEDENSVYRSMNASRIQTFKNLQSMDSNSIASAIISGVMATDTQWMRDLMQYDPAKYQEVKQAEKQIRWQMNINAITSGEWDYNTVATNWQSGISNEITDFALSSSNWITSTADILKSVNSSLSSNQNAATASEQMATIESDMATLQNRMKNLKKEANQVFKWDVPQYIVNAYVANRTAEIQDQLSILENRYNAAQSRYQQEWEQTKWNAEFWLKQQELQLKREGMVLDDWATRQWIALDWAKLTSTTTSTSTTINWNTVQTTSLSRDEISTSIDDLVQKCKNKELWNAQCATWIQKYYLPTLWVDLWSLSAYSAKQGICNQLAWEYTPQKWDVVVMSSSTKPENWHIGIVVGIDWDTMTYLDWNGSVKDWVWTETAAIRTKKITDKSIYGYYDPTKWQSLWGSNYSYDWDNDPRNEYYEKDLSKMTDAERKTIENTFGSYENFLTKRKTYANEVIKPRWTAQGQSLLRVMAELENMFIYDKRIDKNWVFDTSYWNFWPTSAKGRKMNQIKEQLRLEQLLEARHNGATFGSMTEWEWKIILNASTTLSKWMNDEDYTNEFRNIAAAVWKATYWKELTRADWDNFLATTRDTQSWYGTLPTWNGGWISYSRNQSSNKQSQTWLSAADKAKSSQWF